MLLPPRLLLAVARLAPPELPPMALLLRDDDGLLFGTSRLPTLSPPLVPVRLAPAELVLGDRLAALACGCRAAPPCVCAPDCRFDSESPRAVPPNRSAVALFA